MLRATAVEGDVKGLGPLRHQRRGRRRFGFLLGHQRVLLGDESVQSRLEAVQTLLAGVRLHSPALERGEVPVHRPLHARVFLAQDRDPCLDAVALVSLGALKLRQRICDEVAVTIDLDHLLQDSFLELVFGQPIRAAVARPVAITR
ncbi:MAG: hypothetical protein H0U04_09175 [Rubrobacter sp.]|nr:hypothetical protein [Rubrobacter sp.]